jgi:hypothetical protein
VLAIRLRYPSGARFVREPSTQEDNPMFRGIRIATIAALLLAFIPSSASAVATCKVKVNSKTGTIDTYATGVSGPLLWGDRSGNEIVPFANANSCIVNGTATGCEMGLGQGDPRLSTPPDRCILYLKDSGAECSVFMKKCTPGLRTTNMVALAAMATLAQSISLVDATNTLVLSGVNLQLVNGQGSTPTSSGTGNLIIGYAESGRCALVNDPFAVCNTDADCAANVCQGGTCIFGAGSCGSDSDCPADTCTIVAGGVNGSHNIFLGILNTTQSVGGIVAGISNTINGPFASVVGGAHNIASEMTAMVTGGEYNVANGPATTVNGGIYNLAGTGSPNVDVFNLTNAQPGEGATVNGGFENVAGSGAATPLNQSDYSFIQAGSAATVTGGDGNYAGGGLSVVAGGVGGKATGIGSAVSGGYFNTASARYGSVTGGVDNIAGLGTLNGPTTTAGDGPAVCGGSNNTASGTFATVTGGNLNTASGGDSSISGGASLSASASVEWHAGERAGFPTGTEY